MKTGLLLGLAILAGCTPKQITSRSNVYKFGISTEAEMMIVNGQPSSRTIASDGTITDIYPLSGATITSTQPAGPDGKPTPPADLIAHKPELVLQHHYVYSPEGILRKIFLDFPTIGPEGEIVHHLTDMSTVKVRVVPNRSAL
jgi:hypothetical protein